MEKRKKKEDERQLGRGLYTHPHMIPVIHSFIHTVIYIHIRFPSIYSSVLTTSYNTHAIECIS